MAKITPNVLVSAISGRPCHNDDIHYLTNRRTGKVYATKLCNPCDGSDPSELQQQVRTEFTSRSSIVKAWRSANAPTDAQPKGSAEFQAMMKLYKAQNKIGNWFAFVRTKIKDGAIPSFITGTVTQPSGGTANPPSDNGQTSDDELYPVIPPAE